MSFFERIGNGWELVKRTLGVLKEDKEILAFPIISAIIQILVFVGFVFAVLALTVTGPSEQAFQVVAAIFFVVFLIIVHFVNTFFKSAIITSATIRLNGKDPSFSDGLKTPSKHMMRLFAWAIILVIVDIVIGAIRGNKNNKQNVIVDASRDLAANAAETAWNLLTYFVIPILIFEELSIWESTKKSTALFKKTWGENLTSQFTIGTIFFLISLVIIIPCVLLIWTGIVPLIWIGIITLALGIIILSVLQTSVNGILIASLYYYATKDKIPKVFEGSNPREFFKKK